MHDVGGVRSGGSGEPAHTDRRLVFIFDLCRYGASCFGTMRTCCWTNKGTVSSKVDIFKNPDIETVTGLADHWSSPLTAPRVAHHAVPAEWQRRWPMTRFPRPILQWIAFAVLFLTVDVMAQTQPTENTAATQASESADEASKPKTFNDWVVRCGGPGLQDAQCYISQNLFVQESGIRLLSVAVGYLGPDNAPRLFFTVPLNVFLPVGMAFSIDGGKQVKLPFRVCVATGCNTEIALDENLIRGFIEGSQAKVAFMDNSSRKQITVNVSLKGFTKAFAALR